MKLINDNNDSNPIKVNLNSHVHCSFNQDTKYFTQLSHKWDLKEYKPYRFLDANKSKIVVCHSIIKMDFMEIYKSPRNALYDAACCMTVLNQGCRDKLYPPHIMKQIYNLKYQFSEILYQDHKCSGVVRQANRDNPSTDLMWFFFGIDGHVCDWHIPENEIPFQYNILKYIPNKDSSYYNKDMSFMNFGMQRALVRWVINNWKNNNMVPGSISSINK
jgi:hypothetical protein